MALEAALLFVDVQNHYATAAGGEFASMPAEQVQSEYGFSGRCELPRSLKLFPLEVHRWIGALLHGSGFDYARLASSSAQRA